MGGKASILQPLPLVHVPTLGAPRADSERKRYVSLLQVSLGTLKLDNGDP